MIDRRPTIRERALRFAIRHMHFYPQLLLVGVKVDRVSEDYRTIEVSLRLRPWNRNINGSLYCGCLFSMADPFHAMIIAANLGEGHIVWDKRSHIRFRKPGKGTVRAVFHIPEDRIESIAAKVLAEGKAEVELEARIVDEQGELVAEVEKVVYVRREDGRP